MSVCDNYKALKSLEKQKLFTELFELKDEKSKIEKRIKELEKVYKPDLLGLQNDIFYVLDNGLKFSIKCSKRKGNVDTVRMENDGIDVDGYRKPDTTIHTLRKDK